MRITPRLFTVALATALAGAAQANLLTNGSFESGTFVPPSNQTMTLAPGAGSLTGWQIVNDSLAWIGVGNPWSLAAYAGDRFLDLSDYSAGAPFGGVVQSIATVPGALYELTFQLGSSNRWGRPSALVATAGNASQSFTSATTGTLNDWELGILRFTATGPATTISLVGNSGVNYIGVDDVSVVLLSVPEPASAWLLLAGLGAVAFGARRRLKATSA